MPRYKLTYVSESFHTVELDAANEDAAIKAGEKLLGESDMDDFEVEETGYGLTDIEALEDE